MKIQHVTNSKQLFLLTERITFPQLNIDYLTFFLSRETMPRSILQPGKELHIHSNKLNGHGPSWIGLRPFIGR